MKDQRRRTPPLAAPPLRRDFPSFTSSYVFGGAVMIRRSSSSNSAMAADEASPEGRSASAPSPAGSSCAMSCPPIRCRVEHATIDHPRQRSRPTPCDVQVLTLSADAGAPLGGGGPMQIVKGGDRGRDVVVRPGEVPPGLRRQLGDVVLDAGSRDVDEDRQEQGKRRLTVAVLDRSRQPRAARLVSSTAATTQARGSWSGPNHALKHVGPTGLSQGSMLALPRDYQRT